MKLKDAYSIFVVMFFLMLLLPLVFINPSGGAISEQENRVLAVQPNLSDLLNQPADYVRQFDEWFSDNVGFREQLINLKQKIEDFDEPVQYTDGEYVYLRGQQGHRYFAYTDGWMIGKFQGKEFLTNEQLSGMASGLDDISQYLNEKGIPLIAIICPDKESVYPEYYPKSIIRGSEPIQLDIITQYLKEHTNIDVYNIKNRLVAEKENYLSYNKAMGDLTHYNRIGAFFEYLELMSHINIYFPDMKPYTFDDVDITCDEDGVFNVSLQQEAPNIELDPGFFDNIEVNRPFTWQQRAFENLDRSLPTILFMRDSYTDLFVDFIAPHFGNTIAIHYSNLESFEEYITLYDPDIVVFESAERELCSFADTINNTDIGSITQK